MLASPVTLSVFVGFKNKIYTMMVSTLFIGLRLLFSGLLHTSRFIWFAVFSVVIPFVQNIGKSS